MGDTKLGNVKTEAHKVYLEKQKHTEVHWRHVEHKDNKAHKGSGSANTGRLQSTGGRHGGHRF